MVKTCILWEGSKQKLGYGTKRVGKKVEYVHRLEYQKHNPTVDITGLSVCHTCDNPSCYNIDHLFLGTHTDNMQDKMRKGRGGHLFGEDHPVSKLTSNQVEEIREIYASTKITQRALAKRYNVSREAISAVVTGRNRKLG